MYRYRRLLTFAALLVLASAHVAAKVVDVDEASRVAAAFMALQPAPDGQTVRVKQIKPSTDRLLAPAAEDPAFYIFAPEDGDGFAIVSADDAAMPVLGYSDTQSIDMDNLPPALETLMNQWAEQIRLARSQGLTPTEKVKEMWAMASPSMPDVVLETALWHQRAPFNNECPEVGAEHCLAGCVPVHYAIIMRYHKYARATSITTYPYRGKMGVNVPARKVEGAYDWDSLPMTYPQGGYGDARDDEAARMLADLGALCQADYGTASTSALQFQPEMLVLFGYKYEQPVAQVDFTAEEWDEMLMGSLDRGRPISYVAYDHARMVGHAFILDGYNADGMYHVNWGWGGTDNGFFTLDALRTGLNHFKSDQTAILDIRPKDEAPGGIDSAVDDDAVPVAYYTIDGRMVDHPRPGSIVITKLSDGTTAKKFTGCRARR